MQYFLLCKRTNTCVVTDETAANADGVYRGMYELTKPGQYTAVVGQKDKTAIILGKYKMMAALFFNFLYTLTPNNLSSAVRAPSQALSAIGAVPLILPVKRYPAFRADWKSIAAVRDENFDNLQRLSVC